MKKEEPRLPDIVKIRKIAKECGYAIGEHGSKIRDYDLIAVPWVEKVESAHKLVNHLCKGLNAVVIGKCEFKPYGRIAVIIQIDGWYKHIDLSIMLKR